MENGHHGHSLHPSIDDPNVFVLYRYDPSVAAAMLASIIFSLTTVFHVYQVTKCRTLYFIPFIVGGVFDIFGYVLRCHAHNQPRNINIYIPQQLFILLAPALFAASIYLTLDRIIFLAKGEKLAPIPARWLTCIFVSGDVFSFVVQSTGVGLMASKNIILGQHLVIIALLTQIVSFVFFVFTAGIFHFRLTHTPTPASVKVNWQRYIYTLYAASILIFTRSVFRAVEFASGNDGFLMRHEIFVYIFDGIFMVGVMVLFNIIHPGYLTSIPLTENIMLGAPSTNKGDSTITLHGSDEV